MNTILNFLNRRSEGARVFIVFVTVLPITVALAVGFARLITDPTMLGAYLPHDAGNIKESLIGYDQHNHMTLNGVPLGVILDHALPACPGDPKESSAPCHGPMKPSVGGSLYTDIYGFDAGKDRDGKPVVTSMTVYTEAVNDMTIASVTAGIATTSAVPTIVNTTDALGSPTMRSNEDMKDIVWHRSGKRLVMTQWLDTDHADMILSNP